MSDLVSLSIDKILYSLKDSPKAALLFSGGKDSIVLADLCLKAFAPKLPPITLLHIDTGHNFSETLAFRDEFVQKYGWKIKIGSLEEDLRAGRIQDSQGPLASRNRLQSVTLLRVIQEEQYKIIFGGARRDEEKARAKERYFSLRGEKGSWDPEHQRPELWNHAYLQCKINEHWRVFPLNHWTENDIWNYIVDQKLELPSLYFAHERELLLRDGVYYAKGPQELYPNEKIYRKKVRFRTVGDMTCTGAWISDAQTREQIRDELRLTRVSERGSRMDDRVSAHAMEERKKEGYF